MFPLGSVLVPGMILPLHVFEERYRRLVHDCLAGDGEFGVVLIERGSEVGGGDVRTDVGTVARIVQADELPDGRFVVGAVGVRRIRVSRWLEDAPYPRADVADWPDVVGGPDAPGQVGTAGEDAGDVVAAGEGAGDIGAAGAPGDVGGAGEDAGDIGAAGQVADRRAGPGEPGSTGEGDGVTPGPAQVTALLRRASALRRELGEPAPPLDLELASDPVVAGYQATALAPLGPVDRQALLCAPTVERRFELLRDLLTDHIELLEARLSAG